MTIPTLSSSLGVDGGAIFQIAATENLGIGSRALGIAFGLGVLSVPLQLWAARLPLWRARRNLQIFLVLTSLQCAVLAVLIAALKPADSLVVTALGVTVLAEINVSVLFATTWQPLLAYAVTPLERQRISSRGRAASGAFMAVAAVVFGTAGEDVRIGMLAVAAAGALALAAGMRRVPVPDRPVRADGDPRSPRGRIPAEMRVIYVALGLAAFSSWPLFITYVNEVLWPGANLGIVAAVQLAGMLVASASWRATSGDLAPRARLAAMAYLGTALLLAAVRAPVDSAVEGAAVVVALFGESASGWIVFMSLLELAHRVIDEHTSVRAMTVYDVVGSTSMQAGLVVAGFLIAVSGDRAWPIVDPYRAWLLASVFAVVLAVTKLVPRRPAPE